MKLNLYNYVSSDKNKPILHGVFHEDGYQIATDGNIMVKVKSDYPDAHEKKVLDKEGDILDILWNHRPYVNYQAVIKSHLGRDLDRYPLESDFLQSLKSDFKEWKKQKGVTKRGVYGSYTFENGAVVEIGKFILFLEAAKALGATELLVHSGEFNMVGVTTEKGVALLAGLMKAPESDNITEFFNVSYLYM
jgi:hypothetical protein